MPWRLICLLEVIKVRVYLTALTPCDFIHGYWLFYWNTVLVIWNTEFHSWKLIWCRLDECPTALLYHWAQPRLVVNWIEPARAWSWKLSCHGDCTEEPCSNETLGSGILEYYQKLLKWSAGPVGVCWVEGMEVKSCLRFGILTLTEGQWGWIKIASVEMGSWEPTVSFHWFDLSLNCIFELNGYDYVILTAFVW